jgi:hypothetical protein
MAGESRRCVPQIVQNACPSAIGDPHLEHVMLMVSPLSTGPTRIASVFWKLFFRDRSFEVCVAGFSVGEDINIVQGKLDHAAVILRDPR